jgi:extracellular elastinolytic metalloproteinase
MTYQWPDGRLAGVAVVGAAVVALAATGLPAAAQPRPATDPAPATAAGTAPGRPGARSDFDSRTQAGHRPAAAERPAQSLRRELGLTGVVDLDGLTGTPRQVARLDGYLSGASRAKAPDVALAYVRSHPDVFRLSDQDLAGLRMTRDYLDVAGIHHVSWVQTAGGLELFGNGLKANVSRDGRLISVQGSPVSGLTAPPAPKAARFGDGAAAVAAAKRDLRDPGTATAQGDTAQQMLFQTASGTRRAWRTITMGAERPAVHLLDAETGQVLYRMSLSHDMRPSSPTGAAGKATGSVWENYPGAPAGGKPRTADFSTPGWLPAGAKNLSGNNVHTYSDVNDDNKVQAGEEIPTAADGSFNFKQTPFKVTGQPCDKAVCSWDPSKSGSWKTNRQQSSTQNFYFINTIHDHLAAAPIGFTEAAGNFQLVNKSGKGKGGDPVLDEPLDGAATANGNPDSSHVDNANMDTPPDGMSPRMQMYLFHAPGAAFPDEDPFLATNGADAGDIVYHEYVHGLSGRLVVDAGGVSTLNTEQSGSMGEAWSDWYATDLLVNRKAMVDTAKPGELRVGEYVGLGADLIRSQPLDCPVGQKSKVCPGTRGAGPGGYTYGDLGKIAPIPEVHADGEIWGETLWDLRAAVGVKTAESVVTRAMELSPASPSFLDMRNAILQADRVTRAGANAKAIWKVFAARGMGYFAGTAGGGDVSPTENFALPPTGKPTAVLSGTVTDKDTKKPIAKATVGFGGHDSGFPGDLAAVTDAKGNYRISGLFPASYPDLVVAAVGHLPNIKARVIKAGTNAASFAVVRDWASGSGGAEVTETNGGENAEFGCGPAQAIDADQTTSWLTNYPEKGSDAHAVVQMPAAVDISSVLVDPGPSCSYIPPTGVGRYRVEVSKDGKTWAPGAAGKFTTAQNGKLNPVPLKPGSGKGVRYLRVVMLTTQGVEGGTKCSPPEAAECFIVEMAEVAVLGLPAK